MSNADNLRLSMDFFLFDWLKMQDICGRWRFAELFRSTFASVLDAC